MDVLAFLLLAVLPAMVIAAGLSDLTTMTIPNRISLVLVAGFLPAALIAGLTPAAIGVHLAVGAVALVVGAGMFALRWIGGGDAKLMAASCLWLGLTGSGLFLLWTGMAGGLFCLLLIFTRFHARPYAHRTPAWMRRLLEPRGDIPYGVAIAIGVLIAFPSSALMQGGAFGAPF